MNKGATRSPINEMKVNNNRYLIKSHNKFVPFVGIQKTQPKPTVTLTFDDQRTLTCGLDHLIACKNDFKRAATFVPGTCLSDGGRCVKNVFNGVKTHLYDIVQSYDHCYNTNGLISHNCSFVGSSNTLIESHILNNIPYINPIDERNGIRYFKRPDQGHSYVITVDVSRGRGLDYSAFSVVDITAMPYEVVCTFKNNKVSANIEYPMIINRIGRLYNEALILVENNDLGEAVGSSLWYDCEYENLVWTHNEKIAGHGVIGIKTTRKVKNTGCQALKELIDSHQLLINDYRIIQELSVFVRQKKGLYGAQDTSINDDLTATMWLFGWLTQQTYFIDLTNTNTNQEIGQRFRDQIDDYLPFGTVVDGTEMYEPGYYQQLDQDQVELLM